MILALSLLARAAWAQDDFGRVVSLTGSVTAGSGAVERTLSAGATLARGETLKTAARSQVQLLLADKTVMSVGPQAEVTLAALDRVNTQPKLSVKLVVGRLWARIQQAVGSEAVFSVQTSNAVAGVRGTSLVVDVSGDDTRVVVDRGTVDVRNASGLGDSAGANTQALIHGQDAPQFSPIDAGGVQAWLGTFTTTRELDPATAGDRLEALREALGTANAGAILPDMAPPPVPPAELDPAQTGQQAIVRGRVEVAP